MDNIDKRQLVTQFLTYVSAEISESLKTYKSKNIFFHPYDQPSPVRVVLEIHPDCAAALFNGLTSEMYERAATVKASE